MIQWATACQGKLSSGLRNFLTSLVFVYLDVCEPELESEVLPCTPLLNRRCKVQLHTQGIYTRLRNQGLRPFKLSVFLVWN